MRSRLYRARVKVSGDRYSKSLRLSTGEVGLELEEYPGSYDDYVAPLIGYYSNPSEALARILQVEKVVKKGEYIMGIFGGEEKSGKETYAGLAVEDLRFDASRGVYILRLYRMTGRLRVPKHMLEKHSIGFYKLVYRGCVHPFTLSCVYTVILSGRGAGGLRGFINEAIVVNENELNAEDLARLKKLRDEAVQPSVVRTLSPRNYYVIYRGQRTFSAVAFTPASPSYIVESHLAYIDCGEDEAKAFYYTAALNYLAYKAIHTGGSFVRDQFARPLHALVDAGLAWRDITRSEPDMLREIVDHSRALHTIASKMLGNRSYSTERSAFKALEKQANFRRLVNLFNEYIEKHVGEEQLKEALSWVVGERR